MISVFQNDVLIASELLNLTALPNGRYLSFYLGQSACAGIFSFHRITAKLMVWGFTMV